MDHNIVKLYHVTVGFLEVLQRMCFSSHAVASTSLNKPFQSVQNINSMNDNLIVFFVFFLMPLFQDVSANSSPLFSSAENSFDKNKLVVSNSFLHFKTMIVSSCFFSRSFFCTDGFCSVFILLTELQPVQSGR